MTRRRNITELVETMDHRLGEFERWLAATDADGGAPSPATALYADYCVWSAAVERCAKQRKLVAGCIAKYPLLARFGLGKLYDRFAPLGFRIQQAFERLRRALAERRQHRALQEVRQGEVLSENRFEGFVEGHSDLSCVLQPGDDAESPGRETASATERGGGQ